MHYFFSYYLSILTLIVVTNQCTNISASSFMFLFSLISIYFLLTVVTVGSVFEMATCSETLRGATVSTLPSSTLGEVLGGFGFSSPTLGGSCLAGRLCWLLPGWLFSMHAGLEGTATLAPPTAP